MRRALTALTLVAVTALGAVVFSMGSAGAWKCDKHPEKPNCDPPVTVNSTTSQPPVSVTIPNDTTSLPTTSTTTSSTVPASSTTTTVPPEVSIDPPTIIRLAG